MSLAFPDEISLRLSRLGTNHINTYDIVFSLTLWLPREFNIYPVLKEISLHDVCVSRAGGSGFFF